MAEPSTETPPPTPIPFELHEYDRAFVEFISEVVHAIAVARSPLLQGIPRMSAPGAGSSVVDARDLEQLDLPAEAVGFGVTTELERGPRG